MVAIELALLMALQGFLCICSFIIGAKVGQKIVRDETIETNPIKAIKGAIEEHKEAQMKEDEDKYYQALMHNIDNYNGDSIGQVEIPKARK